MSCLLLAAILLPQTGAPTVEVFRDKWGIPNITANNLDDGAFGLGYMHATDNAERMALNFKIARGRAAEVLGRGQLLIDGFLRGFEIEERAMQAQLSPAAKRYVQAYVAGANRGLAEKRSNPDTKTSLPTWIEPFTEVDVLSLAQFVNCAFPLLDLSGALMPGVGSNQFAISGSRTATGAPILSIDPHLDWNGADGGIVWYEAALFVPDVSFRGVTIPGLPAFTMGHNDRFGWSMTNNNPNLLVRYTVVRNPDDATQYSYHGQWRKFRQKEVVLRYRDGAEMKEQKQTLRLTDWGPMVPLRNESVLLEPLGVFSGFEQFPAMMKAKTGKEFRSALGMRGMSMWNFVYAGTDGTIGYQYNARSRERDASVDWSQPVRGDLPNTKLGELMPLDQLPHIENPASGVLLNCNNAPWLTPAGPGISQEWPSFISSYGMNTRYERLSSLLKGDSKMDVFAAQSYATDTRVPYGIEAMPLLQSQGKDGDAAYMAALKAWNGRADIETRGTAAYAYFLGQSAQLGGLMQKIARGGTPTEEELSLVQQSLASAAAQMKADGLSFDIPWGEVLKMRRGEREIGVEGWGSIVRGSGAAPNPSGPSSTLAKMTPKVVAARGSSFRMIVSFQRDGVRSWSILPYGNSHDPQSPYFANQMDLFSVGKYKDTMFNLTAVKRWAAQSIKIWR